VRDEADDHGADDSDHRRLCGALQCARRQAPDADCERDGDAAEDERRHSEPAPREDLDEAYRVESRPAQEPPFGSVGRRLHLAQPVEVSHRRRDVAEVRHDQVPRYQLDDHARHRPQRPEPAARAPAAIAVPVERLERLHRLPVRCRERGRVGEWPRPRQLGEHLALARSLDVERVEERGDRRVVPAE
jgi:hypothetical protein